MPITSICTAIADRGGRAYMVGGCVRDAFLGLQPKDFDFEVYGLAPDVLINVLGQFGTAKYVGKSYGVFKLGEFDFALPRTERKSGVGHKAFDVTLDPGLTIEQAARRRDSPSMPC